MVELCTRQDALTTTMPRLSMQSQQRDPSCAEFCKVRGTLLIPGCGRNRPHTIWLCLGKHCYVCCRLLSAGTGLESQEW